MHPRAAELIALLGLAPHPEGGFFREAFRSTALTTIWFLLPGGAVSRWHRVASDEVWNHLEGDPLRLHVFRAESGALETHRVGLAGREGRPTAVVPGGAWQAAVPEGAYALAGCTVAPGFRFEDFTLMTDDPEARGALLRAAPQLGSLV